MYAYPKHVCTDHPVLVYKTCKIERTVPRLFSCLPPPLSPHKSIYLSQSFASTLYTFAFGSITSTSSPLSLPTALNKVVSLDNNWDELLIEAAHKIVQDEFDRSYWLLDIKGDDSTSQADGSITVCYSFADT